MAHQGAGSHVVSKAEDSRVSGVLGSCVSQGPTSAYLGGFDLEYLSLTVGLYTLLQEALLQFWLKLAD